MKFTVEVPDEVYRAYRIRVQRLGIESVGAYTAKLLAAPLKRTVTGRPRVLVDVTQIEALRRKGYSWRETGARLGISASGACKAWHRHLAEQEGARE